MSSENYTLHTAAPAFGTTTRYIQRLIQQGLIPRAVEVEKGEPHVLLPRAIEYLRARQVQIGDDGYFAARQLINAATVKAKIRRHAEAEAKRQA
jgi:hypothetical protein